MTLEHEPAARGNAVVTDLDEARRRRASKTSATPEAPEMADTPDATDTAGTASAPSAKDDAGGAVAPAAPAKRRRDPANRRFDAVKVGRLKREIAEGRYEIDHWSVADRFIEHERNRG